MLQRTLDIATRAMDSAILWKLGTLAVPLPDKIHFPPVDVDEFWAELTASRPEPVTVVGEVRRRDRGRIQVVDLEAASHGPGSHPGSRKMMARAHLLPDEGAPIGIILHGFAVPQAFYEEGECRALNALGASAIRMDHPWHLRRRARGHKSGEGFMTADPARLLGSARQATEDAAALVAWARQRTDHVAVIGVSLGGLVACLLATQVELDQMVAVAPFCNPASTFVNRLPVNAKRKLGVAGDSFGAWGSDAGGALEVLEASMAPIVVRNLTPRTSPSRITLVCPSNDLIVGPEPITELAGIWGCDLWDLRHGHISVLRAPGLNDRVLARALTREPVGPTPVDNATEASPAPAHLVG